MGVDQFVFFPCKTAMALLPAGFYGGVFGVVGLEPHPTPPPLTPGGMTRVLLIKPRPECFPSASHTHPCLLAGFGKSEKQPQGND